jgi:hypothetical protein
MPLSWTKTPLRFFQHLLREEDARGLDAETLVQEARSVGANAIVAMGGGFSAWYPTESVMQAVNPHMSGDFLGEVLAAAEAAKLRVLVRLDISKGRAGLESDRPEDLVRDVKGGFTTIWDMPQICATGALWQDEVFANIDDLLVRYPDLDGFFFNYLHVAKCHCPRCQAIVLEATGAPVPAGPERDPTYERWRQVFLAEYVGRIRDAVHRRNPGAAIVPYHHVHDGWDVARMAEVSDIISSQVSNPLIPNPLDPQPIWNHWAAEEALTALALKPEAAPLLIQTTSEVFASRQSAMPDARLAHNMLQAAAHGASTAPATNGLLSAGDARFRPMLERIGSFLEQHADWYRDLRPEASVAVIRSEQSRLWGEDAGRMAGAPSGNGHVAEFRGVFEMLADLGHTPELRLTGALEQSDLARFDAIIAPAVQCLSEADAAVLDGYVAAGGTLIVTSDTGRANAAGMPRGAAAFASLPALPGAAREIDGAYFHRTDPDGSTGAAENILQGARTIAATGLFWTPFEDRQPEDDLHLIGPFSNNAPEFTVLPDHGEAPGLIRRAHGAGQAVWLPWQIGALYHRYAMPEYRAILAGMLDRAGARARVDCPAGPAMEAILGRHPDGHLLTLLNRASAAGRPLVEPPALAGMTIPVRTDARIATCLETGRILPSRRQGDWLQIDIDRLMLFRVIALTFD